MSSFKNKKLKIGLFDACLVRGCPFRCLYHRSQNCSTQGIEKNPVVLEKVRQMIATVNYYCDYVMIKICGYGEFTRFIGFEKILAEQKAPTVMLLTSGALLNRHNINQLAQTANLVIKYSLDGHTPKLNFYRTVNQPQYLNQILKNIEHTLNCGISIELNSVLTNKNMADFDLFLRHLLRLKAKYPKARIICIPFPVRPFARQLNNDKVASKRMINTFIRKILENYQDYQDVLAPRGYIETLIQFMINGQKDFQAYDAFYKLDVLPNGDLSTQGVDGHVSIVGNILRNPEKAFQKRKKINFQQPASHAFTAFDIPYLYFNDRLTIKDLQKLPSLDKPEVLTRMMWIKHKIKTFDEK